MFKILFAPQISCLAILALGMVFLCESAKSLGDDIDPQRLSEEKKRKGEVALAGLKSGRQKLRAGIFKAKGFRRRKNTETSFEIYCAFDRSMERIRFERTAGIAGGKYVKLPDRLIEMANAGGVITIREPTEKPLTHIGPFDVRLVGLVSLEELELSIVKLGSKGFFDDIFALLYERKKLLDVKTENEGRSYKLTLEGDKKGRYSRRIHIDAEKEMLATELVTVLPQPKLNPYLVVKTNWIRKEGVFVPKKVISDRKSKSGDTHIEMEFEWIAVNTKIPDESFALDGLNLPPRRLISDHRHGQNVIIGRTDADGKLLRLSGTGP